MFYIFIEYYFVFKETFPVTLSHVRDTASAKTTTHVSQMIVSEEFRYYDYGAEENLKKYGSAEPPPYDLTNLRVPMYIIRSDNDRLSPKIVSGSDSFCNDLIQLCYFLRGLTNSMRHYQNILSRMVCT